MNEFNDRFLCEREMDVEFYESLDDESDENEPAISKKLVALVLILFAFYFFMLGRESVKLTEDSKSRPLPAALKEGAK